jgi:hypothetical protein
MFGGCSPPSAGISIGAPNHGGRIVATALPAASTTTDALYFSRYTESHGHMAPKFGLKSLVCFYCNKKSGLKYDGLITQWRCEKCDSENFLDEVCPSTTG